MASSFPLLGYAALFYLAIFSPVSGQGFLPIQFAEQKIIVQNRVGDKRDIWVHCWSKDNDLGMHRLPYWQVFPIKFHPSIFGNTMFLCTVTWNNIHPEGTRTQHTIVVYEERFDDKKCGANPLYPTDWPGCKYRIGLHTFDGPDGVNSWNRLSRRLIR